MSPAQLDVIKRMITEDRAWRTAVKNGELRSWWDRGVEVGTINGVSVKTAKSLQDAGIATILSEGPIVRIFLGDYNPYED